MTFVLIPGGPAVFSHDPVTPLPDLRPVAGAATGVLGSARITAVRVATAIAIEKRCFFMLRMFLSDVKESFEITRAKVSRGILTRADW